MERNHIIGIILILAVVFLWNQFIFTPELKRREMERRAQDSLANIGLIEAPRSADISQELNSRPDTNRSVSAAGTVPQAEQTLVLENDLIRFEVLTRGGQIKNALLKNYKKIVKDERGDEIKVDLILMEDPQNQFNYIIPHLQNVYHSKDWVFDVVQKSDSAVVLALHLPNGARFIQEYRLRDDSYIVDYNIRGENLQSGENIKLYWENYLDKIELNHEYEKYNSTVYFREFNETPSYCSCRSDDKQQSAKRIQWVSHAHQFFNSSLISKQGFTNGQFESSFQVGNNDLKRLTTAVEIPIGEILSKDYAMQWYIGPNEFASLKSFGLHLEDIIPYGWSMFGTINRYLIRQLFVFLNGLVSSKGLIILLLTLIVKLFVFPLAYNMLKSQAKMTALKPEIDKLKLKYKDDPQTQQMEIMKIYNEFGVNPLGGCFPLFLQMPIWIALYRFFPATIEFRQESFLWASDLTSYDVIMRLPFSIPLFGDTVSLFAFLWVISTVLFTYYSSKTMDFSANPAMIYVQYLMPFIFWFMFNKTAAGLTAYMFFSNLLNIGQTIIGKNYLFDHEKIRMKLEANKAKPKKRGSFQARIEEIMKEQQKLKQMQQKKKK